MADRPRVERVSANELRRIYREGGFERLIDSGELAGLIEKDRLAPPGAGQAPGTRSQIVAYRDSAGGVVLRVHQYLRPDGTIGASGKPDPKYILFEDWIYIELPKSPE